jgi:hypothetical protein
MTIDNKEPDENEYDEGDEGEEFDFNNVEKIIEGIELMVEFISETKTNKEVAEQLLLEITFLYRSYRDCNNTNCMTQSQLDRLNQSLYKLTGNYLYEPVK